MITPYLQLLIVFQCLVFALFLVAGARRNGANVFLALLLGLLAAHIGSEFLQEEGVLAQSLSPAQLSGLLYGPLFYFWVRRRRARWLDALHALPFAAAAGAFAVLDEELLAIAVFISGGVYLIRSAAAARGGVRIAVAGFALIYLLDVTSFATARAEAAVVLFCALLLFVTAFVFAALRRPQLFATALVEIPWNDADAAELANVECCVERERLFLEPELTLAAVAERAGLPPRRVSALINRGRAKNFAEWLNDYRIAEARRLLAAGTGTVLAVAFASGFNSKSAFNAAFKEKTGLTPSQFRKSAS